MILICNWFNSLWAWKTIGAECPKPFPYIYGRERIFPVYCVLLDNGFVFVADGQPR